MLEKERFSEVAARRKRQLVLDRYAQSARDIYEREKNHDV